MPRIAHACLLVSACLAHPAAAQDSGDAGSIEIDAALRERLQIFSNPDFSEAPDSDIEVFTQRLTVDASVQLTDNFAASVQLLSALQGGGPTSPIDQNLLDLQIAHIEFFDDRHSLRVGRQELRYGSQRILGIRDGTNVRRTWDGITAQRKIGDWQIDALAVRLVEVNPRGIFNDGRVAGRDVVGLYATGPTGLGSLDLYYLYSGHDDRATVQGIGDERRHSFGLRSFGEKGAVFWNWEALYQAGQLKHPLADDSTISAWTVATNTGVAFDDVPMQPSIMLSANIASGDSDPGDNTFGTFSALYPRGNYFSDLALLGPANFFNLNPYLMFSPSERLSVSTDVNFHWRLETADGIYGPSGALFRAANGSTARYVSTSVSMSAAYRLSDAIGVEAIFTHARAGRFIRETGPSAPITFAEFTLTADF